jgi:hypothetical protein
MFLIEKGSFGCLFSCLLRVLSYLWRRLGCLASFGPRA